MITTAIVLPVRYYPLSALLSTFLAERGSWKKRKKEKERKKDEEREEFEGKKWVVVVVDGTNVKIGNALSSSSAWSRFARYSKRRTNERSDGKLRTDEACEMGYDIRSYLA